MFAEEAGWGGENGLESWTEFEEGLMTDPNGSEPSSKPEPKREAASCTILILSYAGRFPRDTAGPRSKTRGKFWRNAELVRVRRREDCALDKPLSASHTAGVKELSLEGNEGRT